MLAVDVILVAILLAAIVLGVVRGVIASIGTLVGLIAGGAAAYWLAPWLSSVIPSAQWRGLAVTGTSIGLLVVGAAAGSTLGALVRRGVDRAAPLRVIDRVLGGAASIVIAALAVSLVGSAIVTTGIPAVSSAVASSRVLRVIDGLIPPPVQATLAELRGAMISEGLPTLGALLSPQPAQTEPPVSLSDPALAVAAASVARISGVAYACGTSLTGSGFVVGPDEVVTNAHVVAGVTRPVVDLPGRDAMEGTVVSFDPERDLAVVRVRGLDATPLRITSTLSAGAAAVVAGYPYGGPFTLGDARVTSVGTVGVPDIYNRATVQRDIYELAADVKPGNSGGPLLTSSGTVAGIVFARGKTDADLGFAMTAGMLAPVVGNAATLTAPVSTGACATE
jgi:uncharacterized membrane protein required for colicin V production